MDPQIDKWVVEATTAHEVGVGQWAGLRVQELAEWEDLGPRTPPTHTPHLWTRSLFRVFLGVSYSGFPIRVWTRHSASPLPSTPHPF